MHNPSRKRVFWLFGLSGAGKSTIVHLTASKLREAKQSVLVIDGDDLRSGLCRDVGFSVQDRFENVRRAAEIAKIASGQGIIVILALMTSHESMRKLAKSIVGEKSLCGVYVKCDIATCISRDPKGLYARAAAGTVFDLPGKDLDFEEPDKCDLVLDTNHSTIQACVERLHQKITTYK